MIVLVIFVSCFCLSAIVLCAGCYMEANHNLNYSIENSGISRNTFFTAVHSHSGFHRSALIKRSPLQSLKKFSLTLRLEFFILKGFTLPRQSG
jgi:hypothetical protein